MNPTNENWENAFKKLQKKILNTPTAASAPVVDPNITFASVGGLDEQIKYLRENIIIPLKQKDVLKEWGVEPVKGIIFHGPPVLN